MTIENTTRKIFVSWPGYSITDPHTGKRLIDAGYEVLLHPKLGARSPQELSEMLEGAVGAIVSTDPFTRSVIEGHPHLGVISRIGVGTDSVDVAASTELGVIVTITPGLNAETVADHTMALILAHLRKVVAQDSSVKHGGWERVGRMTPTELFGKTVGLLGAGAIGRKVIRRLAGFDVRILFFDPVVEDAQPAAKMESVKELLNAADVVSLHLPLTAETRGIVGESELRQMKSTAILINTARGPLIDQAALFTALKEGRVGGAALDVFDEEPPSAEVLRDVPNLICSPHLAGLSTESIRRMTISATDSVLSALAGENPVTAINAPATRRRFVSG
jgi:phosphoglycerate dehydrogenase-like enzyme